MKGDNPWTKPSPATQTVGSAPPYDPGVAHILKFFRYRHLPERLQEVSRSFCMLAHEVADRTSGPETVVALRKLLEAKDAAVRAVLPE